MVERKEYLIKKTKKKTSITNRYMLYKLAE